MMLTFYLVSLLVYMTVACDPPFVQIEEGCYYHNEGMFVESYDYANQICQDLGSYLAVVRSGEENRGIIDELLTPTVVPERVLLGGQVNEVGLFEWVDGSLVRDQFGVLSWVHRCMGFFFNHSCFTGWADNQPNGNGDCMGYSVNHNLFWEDFPCENYSSTNLFVGFICEKNVGVTTTTTTTTTTPAATTTTVMECPEGFTRTENGCYNVSLERMTFFSGNDYCLSLDSHLSYIKSSDEQSEIGDYLDSIPVTEWVWIGGRDQFENDVYYWLDGTPIDNFDTNWALDEPDGGGHDYMYIRDNEDWAWGDEPDGSKIVLCEFDL